MDKNNLFYQYRHNSFIIWPWESIRSDFHGHRFFFEPQNSSSSMKARNAGQENQPWRIQYKMHDGGVGESVDKTPLHIWREESRRAGCAIYLWLCACLFPFLSYIHILFLYVACYRATIISAVDWCARAHQRSCDRGSKDRTTIESMDSFD